MRQLTLQTPLTGTSDATANACATISFDGPIKKDAKNYKPSDGTIEWTVTVNSDGRDISAGVTVTDTLTLINPSSIDNNFMEYVKNGGDVDVAFNPEPLEGSKNVTLTGDATNGWNLKVEFKPASGKEYKVHTISYQTKDDVVDKNYSVKNSAKIEYTGSDKSYTSNEVTRTVGQSMISKGNIAANSDKIDYENKTINWSFTLNGNPYSGVSGIKITDTFETEKYQKLYADEFIEANKQYIMQSDGTATANEFILTLTDSVNDNGREYTEKGFTLELEAGGSIDNTITFKYPTHFDPTRTYAGNNVKNNIIVEWTKNTVDYKSSSEGTAYFNTHTANNGDKGGLYNPRDKTVEWYVDINYNKAPLANARVEDTFGPKQTMDEISTDTIKVYELSLSGAGGTPSKVNEYTDYTVNPLSTETDKEDGFTGFILEFKSEINKAYRIEYTTEYKEQTISIEKATNKAILYNDEDKKTELDTEALSKSPRITNGDKFFEKDGRDIKDTDYLEWTLIINKSQSHILAESTIEDTLNDGQTLVTDFSGLTLEGITTGRKTFEIKKRVYERDGNNFTPTLVTLTEGEISELFDIDITPGGKKFVISLKKNIDHEYRISYVTDISNSIESSLSNTYKFDFKGKETQSEENTVSENVTYFFAGAAGQLRSYNVKLVKKDGIKPLENVTFSLFKGDELIRSKDSDVDGIVDFGSIRWGEYTLKETNPASGYTEYFKVQGVGIENGTYEKEYTLNAKGTVQDITFHIDNKKPGSIIIDKVDAMTNAKLANAIFEIRKDGDLLDTVTTDESGHASLGSLPPGEYMLVEITAPDGYAKETVTVTLESGQENTVVVSNHKLNQAVKLTKKEAGSSIKLEGAEFTLHRVDDDSRVEVDMNANSIGPRFKTDSVGEIVINNLPAGTYYFKEVKSPEYYVLPTGNEAKSEEFTIVENQKTLSEVTMENTKGTGAIVINKIEDSKAKTPIDGVTFKLTSSTDNTFTPITQTTSGGGIVTFDNLPYGEYKLTETQAHPDYVIETKTITIKLDGNGEDDQSVTEEVRNTKKDHSVELTKYNSNKSQKLPGAVFKLEKEDSEGKYVLVPGKDKLTTDANGKIVVKDLAVGKYQFVEVTAPAGYVLNATPQKFEISEDQTAPSIIEFTNAVASGGGGGGGGSTPKEDPKEDPKEEPKEDPKTPVDDPENPVEEPEGEETPEEPILPVTPPITVIPPNPNPSVPRVVEIDGVLIDIDDESIPFADRLRAYEEWILINPDSVPLLGGVPKTGIGYQPIKITISDRMVETILPDSVTMNRKDKKKRNKK